MLDKFHKNISDKPQFKYFDFQTQKLDLIEAIVKLESFVKENNKYILKKFSCRKLKGIIPQKLNENHFKEKQ